MLAMKTLNEHIKKGEYQKVYLIYGEEEYLKNQYRDRMKAAIIGDDTINYSYFEGDSTKAEDVISVCETMPFFSDRRLVIVSDSSFFKNNLKRYAEGLPLDNQVDRTTRYAADQNGGHRLLSTL